MLYYATIILLCYRHSFIRIVRPFSGCLMCPLRPRYATHVTNKNPRVFSPGVSLSSGFIYRLS